MKLVPPAQVDYIGVSPRALVGISSALIPFLEHDDSNRALMGANMQRQAVPLLRPEAPLVGTGLERQAAMDSGMLLLAEEDGTVVEVDAAHIVVKKGKKRRVYPLVNFERSNQDTILHQRPVVAEGDEVNVGDLLADGPSSESGELALGRNLLVAIMPFEGYNYEDAIVVSDRLVRENLLDSVHIEEFEVKAEETKLGPEEITSDIPNISKEDLKNLDEDGIVREGTVVRTGDILVGKITPRGESEPTPEEKIFRSIFGERARNVRNTSLRMRPVSGTAKVIKVKKFSRDNGDELDAGVNELVKVFVAQRKMLSIGDKLAGRHGNKGVISTVRPMAEMPFLPDGTPVDVVLNPMGVPSRMNLGQIFEANLGWLAHLRGELVASPIFDGAHEDEILRGAAQGAGEGRTRRRRRLRRQGHASRRTDGRAVRASDHGGLHADPEARAHRRREDPRAVDRTVRADHTAAARRQGAVRRPAAWRDGGVGARGVRGVCAPAGDADPEVGRHARPHPALQGDPEGRGVPEAGPPRVVQGAVA